MPTDATIKGLFTTVEAFHTREGAVRDRPLYIVMLNRALDEISMRIPGFDTSWSNATAGTLTLSGGDVTFPSDLKDFYPRQVLWDSKRLAQTTIARLSAADEDWRDQSGTPSGYARTGLGIILDVQPSGSVTGKLEIWGKGVLPHYEEGSSIDPLGYLALHHQLAIADYVIGNLPLDYRDRTDDVIATMRDARKDARERWDRVLPFIVHGVITRTTSPLGGI